jgi:hypothetical protein
VKKVWVVLEEATRDNWQVRGVFDSAEKARLFEQQGIDARGPEQGRVLWQRRCWDVH